MWNPFANNRDEAIDKLIVDVTDQMELVGPYSDEYDRHLANLQKLMSMKVADKPKRVSRDTMAIVLGNLAGILIIVAYENKHVITSKAFNERVKTNTNRYDT